MATKTVMELDFTGVETSNLLPEGTHLVKVTESEFTKAQTGSDQLCVSFEDSQGATRKAWLSLVPQALWKVKQLLEALGISAEGKVKLNATALRGRMCKIVVEKDRNDETKLVVSKFMKTSDGIVEQTMPAAPITPTPVIPTAPAFAAQPATPTFPQQLPPMPEVVPSTVGSAPVPTQPAAPAVPDWMLKMQQQSGASNIPPWMQQK